MASTTSRFGGFPITHGFDAETLGALIYAAGGRIDLSQTDLIRSRGLTITKFETVDPPCLTYTFETMPPELKPPGRDGFFPDDHPASHYYGRENEGVSPKVAEQRYPRRGPPYEEPVTQKSLPKKPGGELWRTYEGWVYSFMVGTAFGIVVAGWAIWVMATAAGAPL